MSGRMIDADAFEEAMIKKYCSYCDNCEGMKCGVCWIPDMLEEMGNTPEAEVNAG